MKLTIAILLLFYLAILQQVLKTWLKFFQQDSNISKEEKYLSWVILIIGAAFWPIVVPISYISLLEKKLAQQKCLETMARQEEGYYQDKTLSISLDSVKFDDSGNRSRKEQLLSSSTKSRLISS